MGAHRLDPVSYGLSGGPRHAGRRRSGSARLWPRLWLGCSFRLEDFSFRQLGGVGRLRTAQLDTGGAVLFLLRLGDCCLGVRQRLGALPAPALRDCAPCWGRGRGGPTGTCSTPWCTEKRVSHSVTTQEGENIPHTFQTVFLSLVLLENPRQSVPSSVTGLVGIIRLCPPLVLFSPAQRFPWSDRNVPGVTTTSLPPHLL